MISPTDRPASAWHTLALCALAAGAVMALLLVVARTPLFSSLIAQTAFERALVLHVTLISVLWLAAMSAGLWGAGSRTARLAMAGAALMVTAGLGGLGTPVLVDYLPYLDHGLFMLGAGLFTVALTAAAITAPSSLATPWELALTFMRLPLLAGVTEVLVRLAMGDTPASALWGGGHALQIAWTVLLLGLWSRHAPRPGTGSALIASTALLCVVAPGLALSGLADADHMHSTVMRTGLGSSLFVGLIVFQPWRADIATRWATALSVLGLLIGGLIDGQNTTIPAHYHGTVGAVSIGLIALALPRARLAVSVHGTGLALMMLGLLTAGSSELARKQVLDATTADGLALVGSSLVGLGGLVAALAVLTAMGSATPLRHALARRLGTT